MKCIWQLYDAVFTQISIQIHIFSNQLIGESLSRPPWKKYQFQNRRLHILISNKKFRIYLLFTMYIHSDDFFFIMHYLTGTGPRFFLIRKKWINVELFYKKHIGENKRNRKISSREVFKTELQIQNTCFREILTVEDGESQRLCKN